MPSTFVQEDDLVQAGPRVPILVAMPSGVQEEYEKDGLSVPAPVASVALIDTGAGLSAISPSLAESAGILWIDKVPVSGIGGRKVVFRSYVRLVLLVGQTEDPLRVLDPLQVVEADETLQVPFIIGRDVLRQGVLTYIGCANSYCISF